MRANPESRTAAACVWIRGPAYGRPGMTQSVAGGASISAWPDLVRPSTSFLHGRKAWMRGTSPRMTVKKRLHNLHVFEVAGLVVNADLGRRDPAGEFSRLRLRLHQALDEVAVGIRRQEFVAPLLPVRIAQDLPIRIGLDRGELADVAVERNMRQLELERNADIVDHFVPAPDAVVAVGDIVVAQPHVERGQRRRILVPDLAVDQTQHRIGAAL